MTNYSFAEFKTWFAAHPTLPHCPAWGDKWKIFDPNEASSLTLRPRPLEVKQELFNCLVEGKDHSNYKFATNDLWIEFSLVGQKWRLEKQGQAQQAQLQELEQQTQANLTTINNLRRDIEQLQSQKQTLQEQAEQRHQRMLVQDRNLQQKIAQLEREIQDQKQRILALEANKTDLVQQLSQSQTKNQTHLEQEKSHLTQQITLIKEILAEAPSSSTSSSRWSWLTGGSK